MSAIRWTPRPAVICFVLAYSASATHSLWPRNAFTKWQLRNRRYLGVGFGVAHIIHGLGLATLAAMDPPGFYEQMGLVTIIGGGTCYLFIIAMTATSFDATTRMVGPKAWKFVHTFGAFFIWFIFTRSYWGRMTTPERNTPWFTFAALLCIAVMGVRVVAWARRLARRRTGLVEERAT